MTEAITSDHHDTSPRLSIGVSAGSDVVCCAVLTTAGDGTETFDYRTITADGARADTGDLVATSLDLAAEHLVGSTSSTAAGHIAVAYRSDSRSRSILAAARRRDLGVVADDLVSETDAALCWLRHTGEVARFSTVLVVDVGASGTTASVVDQIDGTVLATERTDTVGGTVFDRRLYDAVESALPTVAAVDRVLLGARLRTAKEQLSFHESVSVDLPGDSTLTVSRAEFDSAVSGAVTALADLARRVITASERVPDAVAVVGGGAYVPAVVDTLRTTVPGSVITTREPDTAVAKGAALLARSFAHAPAVPGTAAPSTGVGLRTVGLLAAACAAMAVLLAYGVQALTPERTPSVSTVSSEAAVRDRSTTPAAAPPELTGGWDDEIEPEVTPDAPVAPTTVRTRVPLPPVRTSSIPTVAPVPPPAPSTEPPVTTPSLRPAPDLPIIVLPPLPEFPPWFTEFPGIRPDTGSSSESTPDRTPAENTSTPPAVDPTPSAPAPGADVPPAMQPQTATTPTTTTPVTESTPGG